MRTMRAGAALVAVLALTVAGCGDDDDDSRSEADQEVIEALTSDGATEEQAECFVDALGADTVLKFLGAPDEDDVTADEQADALEALQECDIELEG